MSNIVVPIGMHAEHKEEVGAEHKEEVGETRSPHFPSDVLLQHNEICRRMLQYDLEYPTPLRIFHKTNLSDLVRVYLTTCADVFKALVCWPSQLEEGLDLVCQTIAVKYGKEATYLKHCKGSGGQPLQVTHHAVGETGCYMIRFHYHIHHTATAIMRNSCVLLQCGTSPAGRTTLTPIHTLVKIKYAQDYEELMKVCDLNEVVLGYSKKRLDGYTRTNKRIGSPLQVKQQCATLMRQLVSIHKDKKMWNPDDAELFVSREPKADGANRKLWMWKMEASPPGCPTYCFCDMSGQSGEICAFIMGYKLEDVRDHCVVKAPDVFNRVHASAITGNMKASATCVGNYTVLLHTLYDRIEKGDLFASEEYELIDGSSPGSINNTLEVWPHNHALRVPQEADDTTFGLTSIDYKTLPSPNAIMEYLKDNAPTLAPTTKGLENLPTDIMACCLSSDAEEDHNPNIADFGEVRRSDSLLEQLDLDGYKVVHNLHMDTRGFGKMLVVMQTQLAEDFKEERTMPVSGVTRRYSKRLAIDDHQLLLNTSLHGADSHMTWSSLPGMAGLGHNTEIEDRDYHCDKVPLAPDRQFSVPGHMRVAMNGKKRSFGHAIVEMRIKDYASTFKNGVPTETPNKLDVTLSDAHLHPDKQFLGQIWQDRLVGTITRQPLAEVWKRIKNGDVMFALSVVLDLSRASVSAGGELLLQLSALGKKNQSCMKGNDAIRELVVAAIHMLKAFNGPWQQAIDCRINRDTQFDTLRDNLSILFTDHNVGLHWKDWFQVRLVFERRFKAYVMGLFNEDLLNLLTIRGRDKVKRYPPTPDSQADEVSMRSLLSGVSNYVPQDSDNEESQEAEHKIDESQNDEQKNDESPEAEHNIDESQNDEQKNADNVASTPAVAVKVPVLAEIMGTDPHTSVVGDESPETEHKIDERPNAKRKNAKRKNAKNVASTPAVAVKVPVLDESMDTDPHTSVVAYHRLVCLYELIARMQPDRIIGVLRDIGLHQLANKMQLCIGKLQSSHLAARWKEVDSVVCRLQQYLACKLQPSVIMEGYLLKYVCRSPSLDIRVVKEKSMIWQWVERATSKRKPTLLTAWVEYYETTHFLDGYHRLSSDLAAWQHQAYTKHWRIPKNKTMTDPLVQAKQLSDHLTSHIRILYTKPGSTTPTEMRLANFLESQKSLEKFAGTGSLMGCCFLDMDGTRKETIKGRYNADAGEILRVAVLNADDPAVPQYCMLSANRQVFEYYPHMHCICVQDVFKPDGHHILQNAQRNLAKALVVYNLKGTDVDDDGQVAEFIDTIAAAQTPGSKYKGTAHKNQQESAGYNIVINFGSSGGQSPVELLFFLVEAALRRSQRKKRTSAKQTCIKHARDLLAKGLIMMDTAAHHHQIKSAAAALDVVMTTGEGVPLSMLPHLEKDADQENSVSMDNEDNVSRIQYIETLLHRSKGTHKVCHIAVLADHGTGKTTFTHEVVRYMTENRPDVLMFYCPADSVDMHSHFSTSGLTEIIEQSAAADLFDNVLILSEHTARPGTRVQAGFLSDENSNGTVYLLKLPARMVPPEERSIVHLIKTKWCPPAEYKSVNPADPIGVPYTSSIDMGAVSGMNVGAVSGIDRSTMPDINMKIVNEAGNLMTRNPRPIPHFMNNNLGRLCINGIDVTDKYRNNLDHAARVQFWQLMCQQLQYMAWFPMEQDHADLLENVKNNVDLKPIKWIRTGDTWIKTLITTTILAPEALP
jgi:hypothetical protein